MQALNKDDDRINIKFDVIEKWNKSIKKLLKNDVDQNSNIILDMLCLTSYRFLARVILNFLLGSF